MPIRHGGGESQCVARAGDGRGVNSAEWVEIGKKVGRSICKFLRNYKEPHLRLEAMDTPDQFRIDQSSKFEPKRT